MTTSPPLLTTPTSPECILSIIGHCVSLIQNDHLKSLVEYGPGTSKGHDLSSDNPNAAIVRCIQLQHHGGKLLLGVEGPGTGQDGTRLPSPWRPIEKQVRDSLLVHESLDWRIHGKGSPCQKNTKNTYQCSTFQLRLLYSLHSYTSSSSHFPHLCLWYPYVTTALPGCLACTSPPCTRSGSIKTSPGVSKDSPWQVTRLLCRSKSTTVRLQKPFFFSRHFATKNQRVSPLIYFCWYGKIPAVIWSALAGHKAC